MKHNWIKRNQSLLTLNLVDLQVYLFQSGGFETKIRFNANWCMVISWHGKARNMIYSNITVIILCYNRSHLFPVLMENNNKSQALSRVVNYSKSWIRKYKPKRTNYYNTQLLVQVLAARSLCMSTKILIFAVTLPVRRFIQNTSWTFPSYWQQRTN